MSSMKFAENVLAGLLVFIIVFIIVPSLTYYLTIFYSHRSNPFVHKRHYQLLIALNILLMASLVGDKSLYMISIIITDSLEEAHSHILYTVSDYVYFVVGPSILITMSLICWMVYYDISWAIVTNPKNQWTHFINPSYQQQQSRLDLGDIFANNWFIKHQQNLGNIRWVIKYIIVPFCCVVNVSLFVSLSFAPHLHYFIFMAWTGLCTLFIVVTYWNIPKETVEIFKIKKQLDYMLSISVSFLVFFIAYVVLRLFLDAPSVQYMIIMTFQYMFTAHYFIAGLLSTRYVLIECGLVSRNKVERRHIVRVLSHHTSIGSKSHALPLAHILSNRVSLNAFMSHLLKEFSSENLLAIFECLQYKQMIEELNAEQYAQHVQQDSHAMDSIVVYIEEAIRDGAVEEYVYCGHLLIDPSLSEYRLPPKKDIPQSVIVFDANLSARQKAWKLVEKYVYSPSGCMFEVNISSSCRSSIIRKCSQFERQSKIQIQELYSLFDEMILELIGLSNDSHRRFVQSDAYSELIKHVDV